MTRDVFVSYAAEDQAVGYLICGALEARGITCWIAPRDIMPGTTWGHAIIDGINNCRVLVLVFSSHSNDSPHCLREVERAVNRKMTILPFRIEDVPPSEAMEFFISVSHWFDATQGDLEIHVDLLVRSLVAMKAAWTPKPPEPVFAGDPVAGPGFEMVADELTSAARLVTQQPHSRVRQARRGRGWIRLLSVVTWLLMVLATFYVVDALLGGKWRDWLDAERRAPQTQPSVATPPDTIAAQPHGTPPTGR